MSNYFEYRMNTRRHRRIRILTVSITLAVIMAAAGIAAVATDLARNAHTADSTATEQKAPEQAETVTYTINVYYETQTRRPCPKITEDELEELTRLVYLEAGADWISDWCVRCVTEVAFNQLASCMFGENMHDVLYRPGNYDETIYRIWDTEPTARVRRIVEEVYEQGMILPAKIIFYRNSFYHHFQGAVSEFHTDNVYFSSSIWYQ